MKRLFIAIDIPDAVKRELAAWFGSNRFDAAGPAVRWVKPENLHLTVRFIGDVDDGQLNVVCEKVREVAAKVSPFRILLCGTGVFPTASRAKVLWLGVREERRVFAQIKDPLETGLKQAGIPADTKPFAPHLTIGRVKDLKASRPVIAKHLNTDFESTGFEAKEIVVYESDLLSAGPVYSRVAGMPLTG